MSISTLSIDKYHDVNASKTTEDLYHLQKMCSRFHNHSDSAPNILTSLTGVLLVTSYN